MIFAYKVEFNERKQIRASNRINSESSIDSNNLTRRNVCRFFSDLGSKKIPQNQIKKMEYPM